MNAKAQSLTIVSILLAGAISASAQPQTRRKPQQSGTNVGTPRTCPACGAPQINRQRQFQGQTRNAPQQRNRYGQQYRRQSEAAQNRQAPAQQRYRGQQFRNPMHQQNPQVSIEQQQRRKAAMKRFDRDGDGILSAKEKAALKKALKNKGATSQDETPQIEKKRKRPKKQPSK